MPTPSSASALPRRHLHAAGLRPSAALGYAASGTSLFAPRAQHMPGVATLNWPQAPSGGDPAAAARANLLLAQPRTPSPVPGLLAHPVDLNNPGAAVIPSVQEASRRLQTFMDEVTDITAPYLPGRLVAKKKQFKIFAEALLEAPSLNWARALQPLCELPAPLKPYCQRQQVKWRRGQAPVGEDQRRTLGFILTLQLWCEALQWACRPQASCAQHQAAALLQTSQAILDQALLHTLGAAPGHHRRSLRRLSHALRVRLLQLQPPSPPATEPAAD
jgi:hypothetical protein